MVTRSRLPHSAAFVATFAFVQRRLVVFALFARPAGATERYGQSQTSSEIAKALNTTLPKLLGTNKRVHALADRRAHCSRCS
jgi:hypothetical protein